MTTSQAGKGMNARELWEQELFAGHRWGRHGDKADAEHARLKKLWEEARPLDEKWDRVIDRIVAIEICNWNLEEGILTLCGEIGGDEPGYLGTGHLASVSEERWKKLWAYRMALGMWLPSEGASGYGSLLKTLDPDRSVENHIHGMLGDRSDLKELYVARLCLCLDYWLGGLFPDRSAQMRGHKAAVSAIEEEIKQRDPDGQILKAMEGRGGYGALFPCHHKAFRRYDIIISSIGEGKWRGAMPRSGSGPAERAAMLDKYVAPVEAWIDGAVLSKEDELAGRVCGLLGEPDAAKVFLAALLASLLRAMDPRLRR